MSIEMSLQKITKEFAKLTKEIRSEFNNEELPLFNRIDRIESFASLFGLTQRGLASALGISKTEIARLSKLHRLPSKVKQMAHRNGVQKWALVEITNAPERNKPRLYSMVLEGKILSRKDVLKVLGK